MSVNPDPWRVSRDDSVPTVGVVETHVCLADLPLNEAQIRAVQLALSALLSRFRGNRKWAHLLCQQLAALSGLREGPWPTSGRALHSLGLRSNELDNCRDTAADGVFPVDVLAAFVPFELWPMLWELIEQGPRPAGRRVEKVFRAWAKGETPNGGRRRNGRLAAESIELQITCFWALIDELCELKKDKAHPAFRRWRETDKPRRLRPQKLDAIPSRKDSATPEQLMARKVMRRLDERVREQRRTQRGQETLFCLLRNRVIVALFLLLGARREELTSLHVFDFRDSYPFVDGAGPAIIIRPNKTDPGVERAKALPEIVAVWLREYLAYAGHAEKPDLPLWLPNRRKSLATGKGLDAQQLVMAVVGAFEPFSARRISPRALRHLSSKLVYDFGNSWVGDNAKQIRIDKRLPSAAQTFPDVLHDHALRHVADRYSDVGSESGREYWGRLAALGAWKLIWGAEGARKGPDLEQIAAAQQQLTAREALVASVRGRIDSLRTQKSGLRASGDEINDTHELVHLMLRISGIDDEIALAYERLLEAAEAVKQSEAELLLARQAEVPISDDLSEEEVDALTAAAEVPAEAAEETRPIIRHECTPEEFRAAYGRELLSRATLNRYLRGYLPHEPGDFRNPFEPNRDGGRPACVIEVSARDVRIRLDLLDWARFPVEIQERFDELTRTPWPKRRGRRFGQDEA